MFRLSREPALILVGGIGPGVALVVSFFVPTGDTLGTAINAVAVAVAGIVTSVIVHDGRTAPTVMGLVQALVVFGMAAGLHLDPTQQAGILTFVGIVVAAFLRTQISAPVDEMGVRRARPVAA